MSNRNAIWFIMKGLAFACLGGILYTLFCMGGF
jgi:hypothetical protein